jgi:hypothetical protein
MNTHIVSNSARRFKLAALALVVGLSACAAPSQPYLDNARALCSTGDQFSCGQIPQFQSQVNAEHNEQAGKIALGVLVVLGAVAGAAAAAHAPPPPPPPPPVVIVCRFGC